MTTTATSYDAHRIIQHAKIAATFFQALLVEGVGAGDAASLTSSYMIRIQYADADADAASQTPPPKAEP